MLLQCAGVSDVGRTRKANEDFFAADPARGLFVVADGLGGHVAGRVASETAVESFMGMSCGPADVSSSLASLRASMRGANSAILDRVSRDPDLKGMATTLAALWVRGTHAVVAHVGDSRIYLLRGRRLHALTIDHSYVCELLFRRRIDAEAARRHPNRHVILRALGVLPPPEPDLCALELQPDDLFLLCTDGVHGQLEDPEIRDALLVDAGAEVLARGLIERANEHGGQDNATAVLVRVGAVSSEKSAVRGS